MPGFVQNARFNVDKEIKNKTGFISFSYILIVKQKLNLQILKFAINDKLDIFMIR